MNFHYFVNEDDPKNDLICHVCCLLGAEESIYLLYESERWQGMTQLCCYLSQSKPQYSSF